MFKNFDASVLLLVEAGLGILSVIALLVIYQVADRKIKEWKEQRLLDVLVREAFRNGHSVFRYGKSVYMVSLDRVNAVRKQLNFFRRSEGNLPIPKHQVLGAIEEMQDVTTPVDHLKSRLCNV